MKCQYCNITIKDTDELAIHLYENHKDKCIELVKGLFKIKKINRYLEKNLR